MILVVAVEEPSRRGNARWVAFAGLPCSLEDIEALVDCWREKSSVNSQSACFHENLAVAPTRSKWITTAIDLLACLPLRPIQL